MGNLYFKLREKMAVIDTWPDNVEIAEHSNIRHGGLI